MNRFIIGWFGMVSLASAILATGCAVSAGAGEGDEETDLSDDDGARIVGVETSAGNLPSGGDLTVGNPTSSWTIRPENHSCIGCGPLPDPWKKMGPLPDPWTDPDPSSSSSGSNGDGKR